MAEEETCLICCLDDSETQGKKKKRFRSRLQTTNFGLQVSRDPPFETLIIPKESISSLCMWSCCGDEVQQGWGPESGARSMVRGRCLIWQWWEACQRTVLLNWLHSNLITICFRHSMVLLDLLWFCIVPLHSVCHHLLSGSEDRVSQTRSGEYYSLIYIKQIILLCKRQWNTRWAFPLKHDIFTC